MPRMHQPRREKLARRKAQMEAQKTETAKDVTPPEQNTETFTVIRVDEGIENITVYDYSE